MSAEGETPIKEEDLEIGKKLDVRELITGREGLIVRTLERKPDNSILQRAYVIAREVEESFLGWFATETIREADKRYDSLTQQLQEAGL